MTARLYLTTVTPCMKSPALFDRDLPDETPEEANARMERASRLCKSACADLQSCRDFYKAENRPDGVVAGLYRKRYGPRKSRLERSWQQ